MIIRLIATSRSIEIDDPRNFKAFSMRIEGAPDPAAQAELLGRIAMKHDSGHAWISEQALRDWPSLRSESWWQDGLAGMIAETWFGYVVAARTPPAIVRRLQDALAATRDDPVYREGLTRLGGNAGEPGPETFARLIKADTVKWRAVIRAAGLVCRPRDIFVEQTVARLAGVVDGVGGVADEGIGPLVATPIMRWLAGIDGPVEHFNQTTVVQAPDGVT